MLEDKDETDVVGFLGSVGDDYRAYQYTSLLESEGIVSYFETIRDEPTGTCLVICNNKERAHITELGASTKISSAYVDRVLKHFINAELIFTELYILADQRELCFKLAEMGLDNKRVYGFNLPSCMFIKNFLDDIVKMISFADIVFANFDEAVDFCSYYGLPTNMTNEEMLKELAKLPKINKNKNRIFVVTAGKNPAWVCEYDFQKDCVKYCDSFEIRSIPESLIVDTNGAGDSFAGGFLSQYMRGRSIEECMKAGHWAASMIIQQIGFVIPTEVKYDPQVVH
jgi:adenosine kinase